MTLTTKKRKHLKMIGHGLHPILQVGQKGITDSLLAQLEKDLSFHELIKVRFSSDDRVERAHLTEQLTEKTQSVRVQAIGRNALLYRESSEQKIKFD